MSPAFSIRRADVSDAASIAAVHVASWRETYTGVLPDSMLSALTTVDRSARWRSLIGGFSEQNAGAAFVAEIAGAVCGFASVGPQRDEALCASGHGGEFTSIYVLAGHHGHGIGRALMGAGAAHIIAQGHKGAAVWVLEENAVARRFYERLGGVIVGRRSDVRPEATLSEVAYGWASLGALPVDGASN